MLVERNIGSNSKHDTLTFKTNCNFLFLGNSLNLFKNLFSQFLVLKKNKDLFIDWLKDYAGANSKQASDCYQCLSDWCDEFL